MADKEFKPRIDHQVLNVSRVLFRKPANGRGFVEFIVPASLKCHHERLAQVVKTNEAPDRNEHTGVFKLINLNPDERQKDNYDLWSKNVPGGRDIYPYVVSEASRTFNKKLYGNATQQIMPYSRGKSFPISFFQPNFQKELSAKASFENNDETSYQPKKVRK